MSTIVTVIFTVTVINAINFVDGLDGLAAGLGMIAAASILIFSMTVPMIKAEWSRPIHRPSSLRP